MQNLNKVFLSGYLGGDPERRGNGSVTFSIAVTDRWTNDKNEKQERTNWLHVAAWNGTADAALQYLKKGSHVIIEGAIRVNTWEDDGETKSRVEIVATSIIFLDKKPQEEQQSFEEPPATSSRRKKA